MVMKRAGTQRAQERSQHRGDPVGEVHGIDAAEEHGPQGDQRSNRVETKSGAKATGGPVR